jgi:hypothetical protein
MRRLRGVQFHECRRICRPASVLYRRLPDLLQTEPASRRIRSVRAAICDYGGIGIAYCGMQCFGGCGKRKDQQNGHEL